MRIVLPTGTARIRQPGGSIRIGIAIGSDAVRGIATQRDEILWSLELPLTDGEDKGPVVEALLRQAPPSRWRSVVAAIGPRWVQTRCVRDLPPVTDRRAVASIVRENGERLFVNAAATKIVVGVPDASTATWAAAYDSETLRQVSEGCERGGARLSAAVPTVRVLWEAIHPRATTGTLSWRDGNIAAEIRREGSEWSVRRVPVQLPGASDALQLPEHSALRSLGDVGVRYADAFGSALTSIEDSLAFRPVDAARLTRSRQVRLACAVTLTIVGAGALAAAPGVAAWAAARGVSGVAGASATAAERSERDLASAAADLGALRRFVERRRLATTFLRDLTAVLPDSTTLVTLKLDADGGTFVARAPQGAAVPTQLEALRDVRDAEITGAISIASPQAPAPGQPSQPAGVVPLEQVSVRFRWRVQDDGRVGPATPMTAARSQSR